MNETNSQQYCESGGFTLCRTIFLRSFSIVRTFYIYICRSDLRMPGSEIFLERSRSFDKIVVFFIARVKVLRTRETSLIPGETIRGKLWEFYQSARIATSRDFLSLFVHSTPAHSTPLITGSRWWLHQGFSDARES